MQQSARDVRSRGICDVLPGSGEVRSTLGFRRDDAPDELTRRPNPEIALVGGHEQAGQLGQREDMIFAGLPTMHDNWKMLEE